MYARSFLVAVRRHHVLLRLRRPGDDLTALAVSVLDPSQHVVILDFIEDQLRIRPLVRGDRWYGHRHDTVAAVGPLDGDGAGRFVDLPDFIITSRHLHAVDEECEWHLGVDAVLRPRRRSAANHDGRRYARGCQGM